MVSNTNLFDENKLRYIEECFLSKMQFRFKRETGIPYKTFANKAFSTTEKQKRTTFFKQMKLVLHGHTENLEANDLIYDRNPRKYTSGKQLFLAVNPQWLPETPR